MRGRIAASGLGPDFLNSRHRGPFRSNAGARRNARAEARRTLSSGCWPEPARLALPTRVQSCVFMSRCLGRDSTASYFPAVRTPALGFARRRNAHQLQQPSPKDHRRRFPALLRLAEPVHRGAGAASIGGGFSADCSGAAPQTFDFQAPPQTPAPRTKEIMRAGVGAVEEAGGDQNGAAAENSMSAATRSVTGLGIECGPSDPRGGLGALRRLRPRRECGRGRR